MKRLLLASVLASSLIAAIPSRADTITAIVPFPAGGPLDSLARAITPALQQGGDTVVVDNRAGANGTIGAKAVATAKPDGRTWLFSDGGLLTVNPRLYPKDSTFDADRDLKVVAGIALQPAILVVNPKSSWKTMAELVTDAKKKSINYASGGIGSAGHLTMELFADATGIQATHVPYKGGAPAMTDLLGGQVDAGFVGVGGAIGHVKSGKLRALAVSSPKRIAAAPDVPTVKEAGGPDFESQSAYFVMVPGGTPANEAAAVGQKVLKALSDPAVKERVLALGMEVSPMNADASAKWLATERARMGKLITSKNIKAE